MNNKKFVETLTNRAVEVNNGAEEYPIESLKISTNAEIVNQLIEESKQIAYIESVGITNRERQIIPLVANGFTNKEIAQKLNLSIYTVKTHISNILAKLAINKRVQIAIHAYQSEFYRKAI